MRFLKCLFNRTAIEFFMREFKSDLESNLFWRLRLDDIFKSGTDRDLVLLVTVEEKLKMIAQNYRKTVKRGGAATMESDAVPEKDRCRRRERRNKVRSNLSSNQIRG